MSSKVKSLEKALKERSAKAEGITAQQFAVEGEAPIRLPRPGETVEFTWADPAMVGAPKLTLGLLVSLVLAGSKDGRVNGWVIMDPTMQMSDPQGRPVQVPPLVPVGNAAYSREPKPMTWRFHGDVAIEVA